VSAFALDRHPLAGFDLRPLVPAEAADTARALVALDPWRTLGFSAEALQRYLGRDDPGLSRFMADCGDWPAGVLAVRRPWLRGAYIELLAVFPDQQGRGMGKTMLDWACGQAKAAGETNLWACVSDFNTPARAFYARQGFTEVAPLPDLVSPGRAEILLRKRVE
jgi:ribosomal protein S18 acetylase RimI-like enzyme